MTNKETAAVLAILKIAFPAFCKDSETDQVIVLWHDMFRDDDAMAVKEAVKILISTSKFPPTVADVKEKLRLVTRPRTMTELEAWNIVDEAISYYNAKENFDALPPMLQKLVGSPARLRDWALTDNNIVNSVVQSNFMRSYTARVKQERDFSMIPESTKAEIRNLENKFAIDKNRGISGKGERV